ncbi:unnamed protein product [Darwinula stevensoni]|uniref:Poly(A) RNA polymerase mitochondrial-like central palm domain-containing protein n=1 Tax=Darwinula stevensoni TaxID=69355 RepID=A0A7R8XJL2_9CRUS|nr:unnamed protein product [Darwinula stevensoni]CAG0895464.1 unnamed protein product [Darwinula stevensoni]
MEPYDVMVNQPVVIDNGSGILKAGFAGAQVPKCHFPNYIGRPKHVRVMAGALEGDVFVGPKAEEHRGLLSIRYPMEHGIVTDWNDMEKIWAYVYSKDQLNIFPDEHPVLLTEAPLNPRRNRERAAEIFFEGFNVPALFVSMQAILSLYSTGRTTGVVLDSGDGVTHAVPIYEGFALPHSIVRVDIAGRDVTRYLRLLLRKEGTNFRTTAEFEIVKQIKEQVCCLTSHPVRDEASVESEKTKYTLPDGSTLEVGPARFRAPEVLFSPDLIGEECEGLHEVLIYSIRKSDMDLRKVLFQNIVLSGGSTLIRGFGDKLLAELKAIAKDAKIKISAPQERLYSTWIGGSILASLDTFKKMWVSKKEYDDQGVKVVQLDETSAIKLSHPQEAVLGADFLLITISEQYTTIQCSLCTLERRIVGSTCLPLRVEMLDITLVGIANWEKNEEDERIRLMGVRDLECFLRVSFPNISLQLFGSSCNGFGLKTSDLDIGLIPCPTYVPPPSVNQIGKMLRKCRWITKVFTISQAKVPIVKFTHKDLKLDGDISILEDGALMNTRLLKAYSMIDPRVKVRPL